MAHQLPYHSTLVVRCQPDGQAEYRLEHPGSPSPHSTTSSPRPRPALKAESRVGRRVRFVPADPSACEQEGEEEQAAEASWGRPLSQSSTAQRQHQQQQQCAGRASVPAAASPYAAPYYGQDSQLPWSPSHSYSRATGAPHSPPPYSSPAGPYPPSAYPPAAYSPGAYPAGGYSPGGYSPGASSGASQRVPYSPYQAPQLQPSLVPYDSSQASLQAPFPDQQGPAAFPVAAGVPLTPGWQQPGAYGPQPVQQAADQPPYPPPPVQLQRQQQQPFPTSGSAGMIQPHPQSQPHPGQALQQQQQQQQPQRTNQQAAAPTAPGSAEPSAPQPVAPRPAESTQLQVQANNVSITVTAARLEQHSVHGSPQQQQKQHTPVPPAPQQQPGATEPILHPAAGAALPATQPLPSSGAATALPPPVQPASSASFQAAQPKPAVTTSGAQTEPATEEEPGKQAPPAMPVPAVGTAAAGVPSPLVPRLQLPPGIPATHSQPQPPLKQQHQQQQQQSMRPIRALPAPTQPAPRVSLPRQTLDSLPEPSFDGDVSCWGRTVMAGEESFLDDGALTSGSLSSGLSPRESRPRQREWDHGEALQALAEGADTYSRAARLHKLGRSGPVTTTDALPARLAAQQLSSLAGMARKVQEAISHSQRVFERQGAAVERAVLQRAFYAWKNLRDVRALRQQRQGQIMKRAQWGLLRRCTTEWLHLTGQHTTQKAALGKAQAVLSRGLVRRCFKEWRQQCQERRWKTQVALKDQQMQLLAGEIRHIESRPVRYMQRFGSRRWLAAWQDFAADQRSKREQWAAVAVHSRRQLALKAFVAWHELARWNAERQRMQQRAARLLCRLRLQQCFSAWRATVGSRARSQGAEVAAQALSRQQLLRRAVGGWRYLAWFGQTARDAQAGKRLQAQALTLQAWRQQVQLAAARRALLQEMDTARGLRLLARALYGWQGYVEGKQARALQEERSRLQELTNRLQAENEHLRQDNERLGRVIDSGEWGRGRVAELEQAEEVLRRERDALLELVQKLQQLQPAQQHEAPAGGSADYSSLRISAGSIPGVPPTRPLSHCNSPPPSPGARNKLLVKSGSSFNALVRALKQDLVTSGALSRNPAAAYEVDKLSLSRVGLKAGGELEVEALRSPIAAVAFGRSQPAQPAPGKRAASAAAENKPGDLLQAALRLQSIGGRSVALGKRL